MKPEIETTAAGEEWKPITGYEGKYEVSNLGRIRSLDWIMPSMLGYKKLHKGRILKPGINHHGYLHVVLTDDFGYHRTIIIHRLVAFAFVPGYKEGLVVNHKDENRRNNRADNLEWCTQLYNLEYSDTLTSKKRKVYQYDRDGNFIAEHKCRDAVEKKFGASDHALFHTLYNRNFGLWHGFRWSFEKHEKVCLDQLNSQTNIHLDLYFRHHVIIQYGDDGKEVERFRTARDAANKLHVSISAICRCCRGKTLHCAGYKWRYVT